VRVDLEGAPIDDDMASLSKYEGGAMKSSILIARISRGITYGFLSKEKSFL
jgi:hypothetical protein